MHEEGETCKQNTITRNRFLPVNEGMHETRSETKQRNMKATVDKTIAGGNIYKHKSMERL
jgi:hypothetical protein